VPRTSGLQSPVMELTGTETGYPQLERATDVSAGHTGEVFATKFDPSGNLIASGSMDRSISKWRRVAAVTALLMTFQSAVADLWTMRKLRHTYGS